MTSRGPTICNIAVFGLSKLGACIAAVLAVRGFRVIGYDIDAEKTAALGRGIAPVEEPDLQQTITQARSSLKTTDDPEEAVAQSDASFFAPATPSLPDGSFSNEHLISAMESAARAVRRYEKQNYLFVVNSTVTPGTSDRVLKPALEGILNAQCGTDFGLCYNPEFIALGAVIPGLLEPDFVLIGESDEHSGELLSNVYKRLNTNSAPVERMSNINAELAKISLNCAVTMKISFVNQLSGVCAQIPGADPAIILKAIGKDRRIGPQYLKPGLAFGGPCFPRDNRLFQFVAQSVRSEAPLACATDRVNQAANQRLLQSVLAYCSNADSVGVLGLAYKPSTSVVEDSPGMWLCERLVECGKRVFAHDYLAAANASTRLPANCARVFDDPIELVRSACRVLVITCPWPEYETFFAQNMSEVTVHCHAIIDPWRLIADLAPRLGRIAYVTTLGAAAAADPATQVVTNASART
jgi:UDPglucose 6-dehydrogenase